MYKNNPKDEKKLSIIRQYILSKKNILLVINFKIVGLRNLKKYYIIFLLC